MADMLTKGKLMANHAVNITVTTTAENFREVNEELSRLKIVIGVLLAKLPPMQRSEFINDLKGFGWTEEANLYNKFSKTNE